MLNTLTWEFPVKPVNAMADNDQADKDVEEEGGKMAQTGWDKATDVK